MVDAVMSSDQTLILLNKKIDKALRAYILRTPVPAIRFDMFDKDKLPDVPTMCVFLYDIQEDLELRHGKARQYDATAGTFAPRKVHMRCCYLLTYWDKLDDEKKADNQSMQTMNDALNALLNMSFTDEFPAVLRVVAPSEHLSSLGNFWQSLGDRPRLCLNFNVTIPVQLGLKETAPMVRKVALTEITTMQQDVTALFRLKLMEKVITLAVSDSKTDLNELRGQLSKLQLNNDGLTKSGTPCYKLEGVVDQWCHDAIVQVIADVMQPDIEVVPMLTLAAPTS